MTIRTKLIATLFAGLASLLPTSLQAQTSGYAPIIQGSKRPAYGGAQTDKARPHVLLSREHTRYIVIPAVLSDQSIMAAGALRSAFAIDVPQETLLALNALRRHLKHTSFDASYLPEKMPAYAVDEVAISPAADDRACGQKAFVILKDGNPVLWAAISKRGDLHFSASKRSFLVCTEKALDAQFSSRTGTPYYKDGAVQKWVWKTWNPFDGGSYVPR